MYGQNGKWTVWFSGDVFWEKFYSTYRGIHASDKRVRRHVQYKWTLSLKNQNKSPSELPAEDMLEQEGVAVHLNVEYHMNYKTTCLMDDLSSLHLNQKLGCMRSINLQFSVILKKFKKTTHYH
eukprot:2028448-Ditylum_brightwellii.AAC.1